ncbi:MAG: transposase zinc-binding domain-containing protein, partial [Pseudomonadota bacterium]
MAAVACAIEEQSYRRHEPAQTALYQAVAGHLETFLDELQRDGHSLPSHVEGELRRYLDCGIHARGFSRWICDVCGAEKVVANSCKGRGFCPSCIGRRMNESAALLVEHVLPPVPVRQWVLTLPIELRYRLAYDGA